MTAFDSQMPTLFIFSGLPGSGKTTLAQRLASEGHAMYVRIDTIEQGLRDLCGIPVTAEGYRLCYRIALDNLRIGRNVIADSCNPIEVTRREWEQVAVEAGCGFVNIEVVCSDAREHRQRIETRTSSVPGLTLPSWIDVKNREFHVWTRDRIVVDTAGRSESASFDQLCRDLDATVGTH